MSLSRDMGFFFDLIHMKLHKLPRPFYRRSALAVARELPGMYLCRISKGVLMTGRIVEVEAYLGEKDPASHAYRGKTERNSVMFREGGYLYVYFTYGMHFCANVVTGTSGTANAVLLRGLEPINGIEQMIAQRFGKRGGRTKALPINTVRSVTNGPAKLCRALSIGRTENGTDLCGDEIWIARGPEHRGVVLRSTRIGITRGTRHRWRFYLKGNEFVSPGKPVG